MCAPYRCSQSRPDLEGRSRSLIWKVIHNDALIGVGNLHAGFGRASPAEAFASGLYLCSQFRVLQPLLCAGTFRQVRRSRLRPQPYRSAAIEAVFEAPDLAMQKVAQIRCSSSPLAFPKYFATPSTEIRIEIS